MRFRLRLEGLERRENPDGTGLEDPIDPLTSPDTNPNPPPPDAPPPEGPGDGWIDPNEGGNGP